MILFGALLLLSGKVQAMDVLAITGKEEETVTYDLNDPKFGLYELYSNSLHPSYDENVSENPETELVRVLICCMLQSVADGLTSQNQLTSKEFYYIDTQKLASEIGQWLEGISKKVDGKKKVDISFVYKRDPVLRQWDNREFVRRDILRNKTVITLDGLFGIWKYKFSNTTQFKFIQQVQKAINRHNENFKEEVIENAPVAA